MMMEVGCGSADSHDRNWGTGWGFEILVSGKNFDNCCPVDNSLLVDID